MITKGAYVKKDRQMQIMPLPPNRRRLAEAYVGLAYKHATLRFNRCPYIPLDDMKQLSCLGLIDAAARFDPKKGVKFKTYAILCMNRVINHAIRHALQPCRDERKCVHIEHIKTFRHDHEHENGNVYDIFMPKNYVLNTEDEAISNLMVEHDRQLLAEKYADRMHIIEMRAEGMTLAEIAKETGKWINGVQELLTTVRKNAERIGIER